MDADAILDVLDHGEPLTTPEVATGLGVSQRAAWVYLTSLKEDGLVERRPGSDLQMDTWSLSEAGREAVAGDDTGG
ncbi:MAG: FaeA/PapI family transcriptional regulator [Halobacteriales archaeon]